MGDYNGWTNWATWNVELWIDNEEPWYRAKIRFIDRTDADLIDNISVRKFITEELMPEGSPDFTGHHGEGKPLSYWWGEVNWAEIAEAWKAEKRDRND